MNIEAFSCAFAFFSTWTSSLFRSRSTSICARVMTWAPVPTALNEVRSRSRGSTNPESPEALTDTSAGPEDEESCSTAARSSHTSLLVASLSVIGCSASSMLISPCSSPKLSSCSFCSCTDSFSSAISSWLCWNARMSA